MALVKRFEDLNCWKSARVLCQKVDEATKVYTFYKDFSLRDQISRSSGSVMDNIAEGFERGGSKEFIQYLYIAKGSCGEVRSQLYRALDKKHVSEEEFKNLYKLAIEASKLIYGLIVYLKNSEIKGQKYK